MARSPSPGVLRSGFTTGACAAAAAVAAWRQLDAGIAVPTVALVFPDGETRSLAIAASSARNGEAEAEVIKDAGDDVDITDGIRVRARLRRLDPPTLDAADLEEACGAARLIIRGGAGIGRVTRPGLDVPPGKAAINPVPRRMLADNLRRAGLGAAARTWLLTLELDGGAELAQRTLNPVLGIEGGLSVLGTSGIVIPCSNAAYVATIELLVNGAKRCGCDHVVLVTGGRTHRATRQLYAQLPEIAFVRIGDFIEKALAYCSEAGIAQVTVACMPGKLAKYALGHHYTHAHCVEQSGTAVAALLATHGFAQPVTAAARTSCSVRQFLLQLSLETATTVVDCLGEQALTNLQNWAGKARCELLLYTTDGQLWRRFGAIL